jgi:deazaflavin-dependent oxidoreductase (nitroreductase family)
MAVADDLDRATDSKRDWAAEHTRTYPASGGTEGHESNGVYTLVLATTGRRTGQPRRTCLIYGTSGDDFVVVASKGGADEDPAWFKNLQADPSVGVQVGTRRFTARARVASAAEREPLWAQMVRIFPLYEEYAQKADRADQRCHRTILRHPEVRAPLPGGLRSRPERPMCVGSVPFRTQHPLGAVVNPPSLWSDR